MATQDQIEQQRSIVLTTKARVATLLDQLALAQQSLDTYNRIGLSSDDLLVDESFAGTGTTRAQYRAAITSITALEALLAAGHGTNLESFSR